MAAVAAVIAGEWEEFFFSKKKTIENAGKKCRSKKGCPPVGKGQRLDVVALRTDTIELPVQSAM